MNIVGWDAIALYMALSRRTAIRYSERNKDPLPVYRYGGRVEAKQAALDEWKVRFGKRRGAV